MIRHVSLGVSDPTHIAQVLADLTGGTAVMAPSPPFPVHSWFVLAGDDKGSSIELLPDSTAFDPDAPFGIANVQIEAGYSSHHILIDTVKSTEEIVAIAEREGWRCQEIETGLFKIVKIWIDGRRLVELFAAGEEKRYAEAFGRSGMKTVQHKLRTLEQDLSDAAVRR